jgi:hypothetical protein
MDFEKNECDLSGIIIVYTEVFWRRDVELSASPLIPGSHERHGSVDIDRERSSGELFPWGTSRFVVQIIVKMGLTQGIGCMVLKSDLTHLAAVEQIRVWSRANGRTGHGHSQQTKA